MRAVDWVALCAAHRTRCRNAMFAALTGPRSSHQESEAFAPRKSHYLAADLAIRRRLHRCFIAAFIAVFIAAVIAAFFAAVVLHVTLASTVRLVTRGSGFTENVE